MPKIITLPGSYIINEEIVGQLNTFLETIPPTRLKTRLLVVLIQYLVNEHTSLPADFDEVAMDFYLLFDFLIMAEEELGKDGVDTRLNW